LRITDLYVSSGIKKMAAFDEELVVLKSVENRYSNISRHLGIATSATSLLRTKNNEAISGHTNILAYTSMLPDRCLKILRQFKLSSVNESENCYCAATSRARAC
jgi:hypothetical protein